MYAGVLGKLWLNTFFSQLIESGVGAYMPSEVVPINESWKSVACRREKAGVAIGEKLEEINRLVSRFSALNVLMPFPPAFFLPHKAYL